MPQYLVAIQHPINYDPSLEGEAMIRDIGALNEEMEDAGARFFAGGLESASHAKSLRKLPARRIFEMPHEVPEEVQKAAEGFEPRSVGTQLA